jgi:MFS transporter, DHA2 family, multidrug resistance protein
MFIAAAIVLLFFYARPLVQLNLLTKQSFSWAIALATFYRFGLVMTAFVVPQALIRLQNFRTPEIGQALIWMFVAQAFAFPLSWWWSTRYEARTSLAFGLLLFAAGAFISTFLTGEWHASDFILTLVLATTAISSGC